METAEAETGAVASRSSSARLPKIRLPYAFLSSVYGYELVGPKMGVLVAMSLPWLELFVGVCLVGGVFVGGALLASIGMGAIFTFAVGSALYQNLDISCGCFSASMAGNIGYGTLTRATVITLLGAGAYAGTILLAPRRWPIPAPEPRVQTAFESVSMPISIPTPSEA